MRGAEMKKVVRLIPLGGVLALSLLGGARPAAAQAQDVNVVNTASDPALVKSVTEPTTAPFQAAVSLNFEQGEFNKTIALPAGKRLVIEYVSGGLFVNNDRYITRVSIEAKFNGTSVNHFMLPAKTGTNPVIGNTYNVAQPTRLYTDGALVVHVFPSQFSNVSGGAAISISGYLVDLPIPRQ